MDNLITRIEPGGIAEEMGIRPGDALLEINGKRIADVFDYRYLMNDEYVELLIRKPDGDEWLLEIEKDEDEDIGAAFESGLMDAAKPCRNKCVFCFIDQLPRGMRDSLYFKDDDPRLSFLTGNYVTLTNLTDDELERIIYYHLSPMNISVHAFNAGIRKRLLRNPASDRLASQLGRLNAAGIALNFQIVLCKGINDGEALDETVDALSAYLPNAKSLSVVPVGLSRHRNNLFQLEPFSPGDCASVIGQINRKQKQLAAHHGTRFVYAADEFYIKAGMPLPEQEEYEDFVQLENGVGMLRLFIEEFNGALRNMADAPTRNKPLPKTVSVVTAPAAHGYISGLAGRLCALFPHITLNVYPIVNNFFGEAITVSGLITGTDIVSQLAGKDLGDYVLIPQNALRANDDVFLDGMTVPRLESALGVKLKAVATDGGEFINSILF